MNIIDYFIKRLEEYDLQINWKEIDSLEVHGLLKDSVLKRVDTINYPYTSGLLMCFLDSSGRIVLIDCGNSTLYDEEGKPFYIQAATPYSFRFIRNKDKWCIFF